MVSTSLVGMGTAGLSDGGTAGGCDVCMGEGEGRREGGEERR